MSALDRTQYGSSALEGYYGWTDTLKGVYYGPGSVSTALPKLLQTLQVKKALVVTGRSLYEKVRRGYRQVSQESIQMLISVRPQTDVVRKVEQILKDHGAYGATFWEIGQHAPVAGIRNGIQHFKDAGADVIVAVGGGSPIDASKAIIYNLQQETGADFVRQIAIPTTLSAAEYTVSRLS